MVKKPNQKLNNWHKIRWGRVIKKVLDLQNQIVKAKLNNNMKLVYKLQNQLVNSFEGRALAIRKVITNSWANTPPPPPAGGFPPPAVKIWRGRGMV
jgi:N-terminal domain of reverse transcriptase